eukprot:GHVT01029474.1.p1 GENE.GHVT01029474.1~~GHVT01029474.1.p1  ORF type:complete len:2008 (+),score=229.68 GHVT01029474.1:1639-7662(+)
MTLPSSWMRDVAVNFEHDGKWKNFRNSFTLTFNGQPYKASSDYKLTQKVVKASAKLELPETYSISLLHKGKASNFNNDLTIVYPSGQLMAESDFKLQGTNIEAKSKITTPFRGYEEFSANLNHVGNLQGFRSTANLNTPFTSFTPLSVEVNHNGNLRDFRSSARLEGPFRSVSPLSIAVTHKGEYKDMTSTAKLQYAGSEISAEQAYKIENGNIEGSAELSTPYSAIQNARLTYKHNGNRNNFQSEMTGNFNSHRMNMNLKHRGTPTDFTTTVNGALNRNRISGTVTHSGDLSRFESGASGSYNSHKLGLTFKHAGDLSSFETTGSGSLNNHRGSMNLKHSGELRQFNTEGSAEYNNRRAAFNVKHTGNYRRINTDITGEYDGKAISGSVSYSNGRSIEGSANIRTPFTNWEKIDATFKHTGELNNFNSEASVSSGSHRYSGTAAFSNINGAVDASATAVTTIPGYENLKASFKHNGNVRRFNSEATAEYNNNKLLGNVNFVNRPAKTEGSVNINLPFRKLRNIAAEFSHRGELRDFSTSGSVKYNSKKIEAEVTQKTIAQEGVIDHVSSASLKTPFEQARDCEVKAEFHKNALAYEGKMEVSHNQEKCLDIDAAYDHKRSARMSMRKPHPMQMTASGQKEGSEIKGEADINWNTANPESNIRMEMNLKNNKGDRRITIKTIAPRKTYSVSTGYTNDGEKMMHDFEYDPTPGRKFNYGIEMTKSNRGRRSMYDGRVSVNSAAGDLDASFSHTVFAGRRYTTNVRLGARESLVINHELEIAAPTYTSTLTIKHPRFSRDAVVVTEATIDTNLIKGKTIWEFEDQKVEYLGKIADESTRSEKRYVAEMEMRNPQSNLDIAYSGKLEKTREGYGLETEFKYMTSHDRQHKINSLRANINKIREEIKIDMTNPLTSMRISGRRLIGDYESGIHRYSISAEKDGKTVRSELDVNARDLSIDFKTFSPSDDKFHIYAKYMNPSTIQMEAYHTESGNKIVDGVLSVRLNNSRLLHSRAHVRPTILEDLKMLLNKARSHDFNWIDATSQAIAKELRYKKHYMKALAKPFGAVSQELGSHISSAWSQIGRATGDLYRQNRFYVRDAHMAVQNSINVASENLAQKGRELQNSINKIVNSCKPTMEMMTQKVSNGYAQALDWAIVMTEDAKKNLAENYEAMAEFYNEIANTIREKIPELAKYGDMVTDKIKDAIDSARNHPKIKAVLEAMMELDMNAYFKPLKRWARQSSATTSKMVERFTEIMYRGQEMWHDFSSRPEFQEVKSYVVKAVKSSKWLYEYLEVEENVMAIVRDLYKNGLVTLKNQAWEIADDYLKFDKTRFTVWLPEQGEMQAEAYLPIELSDLKSWPQINLNLMQYWNQVRDIFKAYMPDKDWVIWDSFYKYKPSMDYKDWIPPFTSHATVSSSQHYMTFDKTFYEFAGECSYLLTKDFVDANFSVLVNYDQVKGKMSKKSITVIADDKQLEISPDFKVQIDGKRTELPLEYGKTAVLRVGNMIKVINTNGFQVTCDLPHDRCTVSISGWYFGKVAGLMGTYDNEAATDLTTATNTLTSDISDFAQSWSIGPRCKAVNSAVKVPEFDSDSRYKRLCKQYFEDQTSMFRPCFRQVDPTPFMTMCMNDMPVDENRNPSEADTCKVGAFYVDECRRAGVPLRLPKECVRCEMPNGRSYYEGQNVTISEKEKTVPDSADVVFVVEHGPCNKELVKKMKLLINFYEKNMKKDKLKFVHYGLVGYGGEGVHYEPHSHTLDGELLNKRSSFLLGLDGFKFQNEKADVLAALHYAALYPFRTGVSKSIILLPCQACHEQSIRYADVQQLLLDRDIRLHTFIQDNFKLKSASKSPKSSYIIGVDFNEAYTTKDFKDKGDIEGDANLRKQVLVPKDICNALAMETDGSIWSAPQLTEGRKKIQKMFMDVHSRTVSLKAEPSDCQICECVSDEVGVGMSVCRSCEPRNPIDQLLEKVEKVEENAAEKMPNKPNKKKNWREIKAMRQKRRRLQQQRKNN